MQALGPLHVVGVSESPDNVSFPLAAPRVYVSRRTTEARFGREPDPDVNAAELWVADPRRLNEVLVQARATSYGIPGLRFVTRAGVKILLDEAAGIVIALLVALSAIALLTASVMLASSAHADVQRRLPGLGLRRALGATRAHVTLAQAAEALLVGLPASAAGVLAAILVARGPTDRLLGVLNEAPAGGALFWPLAGVLRPDDSDTCARLGDTGVAFRRTPTHRSDGGTGAPGASRPGGPPAAPPPAGWHARLGLAARHGQTHQVALDGHRARRVGRLHPAHAGPRFGAGRTCEQPGGIGQALRVDGLPARRQRASRREPRQGSRPPPPATKSRRWTPTHSARRST